MARVVIVVLLALAALAPGVHGRGGRAGAHPEEWLATGRVEENLGERATLVHFSSAFCQPCRATRRVLAEVVEMVDGVTQVEFDAESHLDLARRLDIRHTPTVLVLDARGRLVRRASGQPRKADIIAAIGEAVP